jgi:hypothetical protein
MDVPLLLLFPWMGSTNHTCKLAPSIPSQSQSSKLSSGRSPTAGQWYWHCAELLLPPPLDELCVSELELDDEDPAAPLLAVEALLLDTFWVAADAEEEVDAAIPEDEEAPPDNEPDVTADALPELDSEPDAAADEWDDANALALAAALLESAEVEPVKPVPVDDAPVVLLAVTDAAELEAEALPDEDVWELDATAALPVTDDALADRLAPCAVLPPSGMAHFCATHS